MAIRRDQVDNLQKYERRMRLPVNLLGAGGVGSNILRFVRNPWNCNKMFFRVYDFDEVEIHNLNRSSLFRPSDIGHKKVTALHANLIYGHRNNVSRSRYGLDTGDEWTQPDTIVDTFVETVMKDTDMMRGLIVDARDTVDPNALPERTWVKLAYNGASEISFHFKPSVHTHKILDLTGGTNSYEIVPSFYVPAAILAVMTYNYMRYINFVEITEMRAGTVMFDIDQFCEAIAEDYVPVEYEDDETEEDVEEETDESAAA